MGWFLTSSILPCKPLGVLRVGLQDVEVFLIQLGVSECDSELRQLIVRHLHVILFGLDLGHSLQTVGKAAGTALGHRHDETRGLNDRRLSLSSKSFLIHTIVPDLELRW